MFNFKRVSRTPVAITLAAFALMSACNPPRQDRPERDTARNMRTGAPGTGAGPVGSPALIRSDYQPGELTQLCRQAMEQTRARLDSIAQVPEDARGFDNTVLAFETVTAAFSDATTPLTFMGYVSPDTAINAEGSACEEQINQFVVEIYTRKDLYVAMKDQAGRNDAEKRLVSQTLRSFELNGLKLPDDQLAQVKALKQKLSVAESQFSTNLNGDSSHVELTQEELAGLPSDYVAGLKKTSDGSRFIVTARESDYGIFLNNASNGEARRKWLLAYYNRQGDANTQLLQQAIGLRQQIAALMGFSTWADYRTQGRMAQDSKTVLTFLNGLRTKLAQRTRDDIAKLLKFKKELEPTATEVNNWDINYLAYQLKKRDYTLDAEKIREYFPADVVVAGMFDVYSQLLGVHYTQIANAQVWSPDVQLYRIENNGDNRLIGYFYTDFVPRQGKYGHAAAFPLISARVLPDGSYSAPVSAIVANLAPPSNGKPSLLSHEDVVTVFHEFGHIMHQTLTRAPYASLSGSNVAQDFVEAPSQMLENWPWIPEVLNRLSGHYLDHSRKLPKELLDKMIEARDFNKGYYYSRQLTFALLDMSYHTAAGPVDVTAVYDKLFGEMIGVQSIEGGHFPASFGHLMGGYDAGYYGYLWSEVYAADMYSRFSKEGVLSPQVGADYRHAILEQGNMKEALDLLREFLGREPNSDAFFKKLGI
jgi:thimet oligopeptidase